MSEKTFDLLDEGLTSVAKKNIISSRYKASNLGSLHSDALRYHPSESLKNAINVALATQRPLLITGEPGTGKTSAAYYIANKLGLDDVIHFQVKSDTKHTDILYYFDAVAYLREAYSGSESSKEKGEFIEERAVWAAYKSKTPRVLLIDEIDKAPRDFPNDLLMEIDRHRFDVRETNETIYAQNIPLTIITSNSERFLPEAFLRRCVFHHIELSEEEIVSAVMAHQDDFGNPSEGLVRLAVSRVLEIRECDIQRRPATPEVIIWLKVLDCAEAGNPEKIETAIRNLDHIGTLVKTADDLKTVRTQLLHEIDVT